MSVIVENGKVGYIAYTDGRPIPAGYTLYSGPIVSDPDDDTGSLMVWDTDNIRPMNAAELLAHAKKKKIRTLKDVGVEKAQSVYAFINDPSFYLFAQDMYTSIKPASRNALTGRLLQFKTVKDTFDLKKAEISALATEAEVVGYDLGAGW